MASLLLAGELDRSSAGMLYYFNCRADEDGLDVAGAESKRKFWDRYLLQPNRVSAIVP